MKKIFIALALAAATFVSCGKFEVEKTATVNLSGTWMCTVYYNDGTDWVADAGAIFSTYNTAANVPTEIWLDDGGSASDSRYWETKLKLDCNNSARTFGKEGKEYLDIYNDVGQMVWGGKITPKGAVAPGSGSTVDKIEFYIAFADDATPYETAFYVAGYRLTGYPEDNDFFVEDWTLPAIVNAPAVTEALEP